MCNFFSWNHLFRTNIDFLLNPILNIKRSNWRLSVVFLPPTLLAGPIFRLSGTFVLGSALVEAGTGVNNAFWLLAAFGPSGEPTVIIGVELEFSSVEFFLLLDSNIAADGRGEPRGEGTLDSQSINRVNTTLGLSAVRPGWSTTGKIRFLSSSSSLY